MDVQRITEAKDALAEEHGIYEQLLLAERQANDIAAQREGALERDKEALRATIEALEVQIAAARQTLEREKEAHRATIRSFAHHHTHASASPGA